MACRNFSNTVYRLAYRIYKLTGMRRNKIPTTLDEIRNVDENQHPSGETAVLPETRQPAQKPAMVVVKKRLRIRKKGPKKLSVAVICANAGFGRFI